MIAGTHDIINCSTLHGANGSSVLVNFMEHSPAAGALLNLIFMINEESTDFSASYSLAVGRRGDISHDLLFPLDMWYPGQYVMVYAYDLERNGRIMDGTGYQASHCSFRVMDGHGKEFHSA